MHTVKQYSKIYVSGHFNYCLDVVIMPSPSRLLEQILYVLPVMLCFFCFFL